MSKLYASKVIEIALAEVGYLEKRSNSNLDSKTANAGSGNFTKYARDLDNIPSFYNGKKNGFAWCDIFVDWCFVKAFGVETAKALLKQPDKSTGAGCYYSAQFYKKNNQFGSKPKKGAQIFFNDYAHTGIAYDYDKNYVYTVEGNTSSASGVIANGGAVEKKRYPLNASYIDGYGYPNYDDEPETEIKAETTNNDFDVNVIYCVKTQKHGWLGEIINYNPSDNVNGYAGWENSPIIGVAMKVTKGSIKYRVHVKGGGWLGWISDYNINDYHKGYAGNNKPIDAIQIYYYTPDGMPLMEAVYKVNNFGWQHDTDKTNGMDGYAGLFGVEMTKLQVAIKKCN